MPKFELPPLPYAYEALEPHIDAQTMKIHHDLHHGTYVTNLNNALDKHPEQPAGRHPHGSSQQRWWSRQPHDVLAAVEAQ